MRLRLLAVLWPLWPLLGCVTATQNATTVAHNSSVTPLRDSTAKSAAADTAHIKPYPKVIPTTAVTRHGLFVTHVVGEKLYFEIPRRALNKDMFLVGRYTRGVTGAFGLGGERFASRTLRWEQHGDRVILRSPSYIAIADSTLPVYHAVVASNTPPIIAIFPVETYGPDSAPVIDVTRLYTTAVPEFMAGHGQLDEKRSFIEHVSSFPDNIEIEAAQTITPQKSDDTPTPSDDASSDSGPLAQSLVGHWSMVLLPAHPMIPRRADERVGFIPIDQKTDYGTSEQRAATRSYIARFRLEKKDPTAALSDPVKPIIYYIDPATPDALKPWIRKAVLEWQPAFTAAGFSNAIIPMDPPTNDPEWSLDDVRHTAVHWLPSTTENAYAEVTGLQDPRTGETLNGSVFIFHNVMKLAHDWYFLQVGPLDARAQSMTFPDSLMGQLVQYVVAHEIGHALGLYHDQLGSSLYPADSIRSPTWVARMGHTPSIMDYSRFNYVAQPEDHIALNDLIPRVGPYDIFAIKWGYTPIPEARTADDERPTLDRWARVQDTVPWDRWVIDATPGTAAEYTEAVGDADAVWATGWGLKNLRRVMAMLPRVTLRPGEDNTDMAELYSGGISVLGQWKLEMRHVASVVGASTVDPKSGSQPGAVYVPLSRARQQAAVHFLNENAFKTPTFLINDTIASRLEPNGMITRINAAQAAVLTRLLNKDRMMRLVDFAARAKQPKDVYSLGDMLTDVRHGIWTELSASHVRIDPYRRALQASYLDQFAAVLTASNPSGARPAAQRQSVGSMNDVMVAFRGELMALRAEIHAALPRTQDPMTRWHLQTAEFRIAKILDPKNN